MIGSGLVGLKRDRVCVQRVGGVQTTAGLITSNMRCSWESKHRWTRAPIIND